ncbi:MAG TPA: YdcF family protein, partial [Polyangiaceae bacterium]
MGEVALVILGCVVRVARVANDSGLAEGALRRRVVAGARAWEEGRGRVVIVSGGRAWGGHVEADAMARGLEGLGVPGAAIVRERASFTTRENARYVAAVCGRRGIGDVALVTCGWHL